MKVTGLESEVVIRRDQWGIPHIAANSSRDAFFGQGFAQAEDRLGQLEFDRRRAYGQWAQLAGAEALDFDRFARRCSLRLTAQNEYSALSSEAKEVLISFSAGINAYLNLRRDLPPDLALTKTTPDPWSPEDCCAVFLVRHVVFANWQKKLWRGRLAAVLGSELVAHLQGADLRDIPLIVSPPEFARLDPNPDQQPLNEVLAAMAHLAQAATGSNAWALHGSRTESGLPLIAGDPHRALETPSVYYQCHLTCPEFDAIGLSFVGVPGFPHFGHSQRVAWAITNANGDYQDLYVEDTPLASSRTEVIEVKGESPVSIECYETPRGVVVFGDPLMGPSLALRSTALVDASSGLEVLAPMLRAQSVSELDDVMRNWVDPVNNLVSADVSGDIAYRTVGKIPVRNRANSWGPVPANNLEYKWQGEIAFDEMPHALNPESGLIVTANQKIVGPDYPHFLGFDYSGPDRAQRLHDRLSDIQRATVADMESVLTDRVSLAAKIWVPAILAATALDNPDDEYRELSEILNSWDYSMDPDSIAASLYLVTRDFVSQRLANQEIFDPLRRPYFEEPRGSFQPVSLRIWSLSTGLLAGNDESLLFSGESWPDLLRDCFSQAVEYLRSALGPNTDEWRWGSLHQCRARHPLNRPELDPPVVGVGGEWDTVMSASHPAGYGFAVTSTSVARYIFDVANWDNSRWVVPFGVSGDPAREHFSDQQDIWVKGDLVAMPYSPEAVSEATVTTVMLTP